MSAITCPTVCVKHPDEDREDCLVSFAPAMAADDTLTGTPAAATMPAGLTIEDLAVTDAERVIDNIEVAPGQAVSFRATGGTHGVTYLIKLTCSRGGGGNVIRNVKLKVSQT